ncbi:hypothetical protein KKA00_06620, partial [bacterium]|nr:hypothetical protein [bacterium]
AQVFAAIFAVVAIGYSIKIMDYYRISDDLFREKARKAITYIKYNRIDIPVDKINSGGPYGGSTNYLYHDAVGHLDHYMLDEVLKSEQEESENQRQGELSKSDPNEKVISELTYCIADIGRTKAAVTRFENEKSRTLKPIKETTFIASIMIAISLIMLWLEFIKIDLLIIPCLIMFLISLYVIASKFIETFTDKPALKNGSRIHNPSEEG